MAEIIFTSVHSLLTEWFRITINITSIGLLCSGPLSGFIVLRLICMNSKYLWQLKAALQNHWYPHPIDTKLLGSLHCIDYLDRRSAKASVLREAAKAALDQSPTSLDFVDLLLRKSIQNNTVDSLRSITALRFRLEDKKVLTQIASKFFWYSERGIVSQPKSRCMHGDVRKRERNEYFFK